MKIGVTYLTTILQYGYPPDPAGDFASLETLSREGFHYLEMEGLGPEHTAQVMEHIADYQNALTEYDVHVHNFCIVDPELVSLNHTVQDEAFQRFQRTVEVGLLLGAETFHLASYAPPVCYRGRKPYALDGGAYEFGSHAQVSIPDGFSWQRVWDSLVHSCQRCADYLASYGKIVLMEPRIGETVCSVDSMLRLLEHVGRPNLKANFDVGHFAAQREDPVLALKKLEGQFANIHVADNDPRDVRHLPLGDGTVNWTEFFRVLGAMGYDGYLGLDFGASSSAELMDGLRRSRDFIYRQCQALGIPVES